MVDRAPAGMGRPRRARRRGRCALPAELPEAGGRAATRAAFQEGGRALGRAGQPDPGASRRRLTWLPTPRHIALSLPCRDNLRDTARAGVSVVVCNSVVISARL